MKNLPTFDEFLNESSIEIEVITRSQIQFEGVDKGWYNWNSIGKSYYENSNLAIRSMNKAKKSNPDIEFKIVKIPAEGSFIEQYQLWYKQK